MMQGLHTLQNHSCKNLPSHLARILVSLTDLEKLKFSNPIYNTLDGSGYLSYPVVCSRPQNKQAVQWKCWESAGVLRIRNKPICHILKFGECKSAEICLKSFKKWRKIKTICVLCEDEKSCIFFQIQHWKRLILKKNWKGDKMKKMECQSASAET